jgi:hypothetical protein
MFATFDLCIDWRPLASICGLLFLCNPGCAGPPAATQPGQPEGLRIQAREYRTAFDEATDLLRDRGFVVDRRDYRYGVITTDPEGSPTVFEPWIRHNRSLGTTAASTAADLRRIVRVELLPAPAPAPGNAPGIAPAAPGSEASAVEEVPAVETYDVAVEVLLERRQRPMRRLSGSAATSVFYDYSRLPEDLQRREIPGSYWHPIGRDPQLERHLLQQLANRLDRAG